MSIRTVTNSSLANFTGDSVETSFLEPFLGTTQTMYVKPLIGIALNSQLEQQVSGQTLSPANLILLNQFICPFMAYKTWSIAVPFLSIKAYKRSLVKPAGTDTTPLSLQELQYYKQNIEDICNHFSTTMIDLLTDDEANGSPNYPLYRVQGQNEKRTLGTNGSGLYFKRKVTSDSSIQSYPDNFPFYPFYYGENGY